VSEVNTLLCFSVRLFFFVNREYAMQTADRTVMESVRCAVEENLDMCD
jgi:hypothetical protein